MVDNDPVTQEDQKRNKMESNSSFIQCNSLKLCPLINKLIKRARASSKALFTDTNLCKKQVPYCLLLCLKKASFFEV